MASRTVVVTGAAGGIGSALVGAFLNLGDAVVATGKPGAGFDQYTQQLHGQDKVTLVAADLTQEAECAEVAAAAEGGIDVLVNVAGYFPIADFADLSVDCFRSTLEVNLTSAFAMTKAVYPKMRGRPAGRIINVSSAAIYEGVANQIDYVAAKADIVGLTRSLARALGSEGITVNAIAPGIVETPKVEKGFPKDLLAQLVQLRSIARPEKPDDVVGSVLFLSSEAAAMITGQTLIIDGGKSMI